MDKKVNIGLYGDTGHQLHNELLKGDYPQARIQGIAGFSASLTQDMQARGVSVYPDLTALLKDPQIDLISLCSPYKDEQGEHIVRALDAGKHVYAEKPCCLSEDALDRIIETAARTGKRFHEMNLSSLAQPYRTLRKIIDSGEIGEVIQVLSQKSYPWKDSRPGDERVDGGLACQAGIYNARFAEQVAGLKIAGMEIRETTLGNDHPDSECRRAVSMLMAFENGAVGSAVANYSCPAPPGWNRWGYEMLRIFGTKGFVEAVDHGRIGTLAVVGAEPRILDFSGPGEDFFALFLEEIATGRDRIPFTLKEELHPLRWILRAKNGL